MQRFTSLANHFSKKYTCLNVKSILENTHILRITTLEDQLRLNNSILHFIEKHNIKLVIFDSISCNFRCETMRLNDRAVSIDLMGKSLNSLAQKANVVVLVTNQVSDAFQSDQLIAISTSLGPKHYKHTSLFQNSEQIKIPALGLTWSNFVN
jgi:RecA/RadA recombinase